ncbi:MAG: penicillin-binding protein 2 [Chitinophagales bacterium]|nr:penicillin-binding protein 2 [Chitinophagales bacterium]MDW8419108.1 penicillin-binding protein 2 [Chitinophagales bacterium]
MSTKDLFKNRYNVLRIVMATVAILFTMRLMYLQIFDTRYRLLAKNNAIKEVDIYPTRGLVYDRNGELLIYNEPLYDLMVTPRAVRGADTAKLCELLGITREEFDRKWMEMQKQKGYSTRKPNVFIKQISQKDYSRLQEFMHLFPGFEGQERSIRRYPYRVAATILGDIGEVDERQIEASNNYYKPGDYVGKSGIEKVYEQELGGVRGKKFVFVDVLGREVGRFEDGKFDTAAIAGDNIITTLDIKLQEYGEKLMQNKKGSIVAIEPSTGEILAMVSSPGYDPNLLCGAIRGKNFKALKEDTLLPLYSRPTLATYPPGSAFKPIVGLIALQEGVQSVDYFVTCSGIYYFAGLRLRCSHRHPSAGNIMYALQQSCNPYFWQTFRNTVENRQYKNIREVYAKWQRYCNQFGLGVKTGIDLPYEAKGNIPSPEYFDKIYGKDKWYSSNIISLGIGQGEILVTPLQMANMFACIANKGYWITPHVVKKITDPVSGKDVTRPYKKYKVDIDTQWFEPIIEGLYQVVERGTARAARIPGISLCGKTGTAQNPHGDNHSMFAGFAPRDNPKIAIAVVVENGGYGAAYAAPIASLMVEKYLNDTIQTKRISLETKMMRSNLLKKYGVSVNKSATLVAGED